MRIVFDPISCGADVDDHDPFHAAVPSGGHGHTALRDRQPHKQSPPLQTHHNINMIPMTVSERRLLVAALDVVTGSVLKVMNSDLSVICYEIDDPAYAE